MRFSLALFFLPLAALSLLAPSAAAFRVDPPTEFLLEGFFAVPEQGVAGGRILWEVPPSEAGSLQIPGPPPCTSGTVSTSPPNACVQGVYYNPWGEPPARGRAFILRSEPLPVEVWINASRLVRVVIPQSQNLDVEIHTSVGFLGGSSSFTGVRENSVTRYEAGVQAEIDHLPAGTIIEIHFLPYQDSRIDIVPSLPARIALPYYAPEEIALRVAPLASPKSQGEAAGGPEDFSTAPLAFGALFLPLATRAIRPRRFLVMMLVLAVVVSGCASPAPRTKVGEAAPNSVATLTLRPAPGETTDLNFSTLAGVVRNPENLPIHKAVVTLVETVDVRLTDGFGRFEFNNVASGKYVLRIEKAGFRVFQAPVELSKGRAVAADDVFLQYLESRTAGERPHSHPGWADAPTKVLLDTTVPSMPCSRSNTNFACSYLTLNLPPNADGPAIVLPGTRDIEVTIEWDSTKVSSMMRYLGVWFRAPNDPKNLTTMTARPNGAVTHIRTGWEMGDAGHAAYSQWIFGLYEPGNQTNMYTALQEEAQGKTWGPIHVKIVIVKGVVPLEPEHGDRWSGAQSLLVLDHEIRPPSPCRNAGRGVHVCEAKDVNLTILLPTFIPFDATWIDISLNASRETSPRVEWRLAFKGASSPQNDCTTGNGFRGLPAQERTGTRWRWKLPLLAQEADPPYARAPNGCFALIADGDQAQNYFLDACQKAYWCTPAGTSTGTFLDYGRSLLFMTLRVEAHRNEMPAS